MAARRTVAVALVVHGVHAVLWALDELFACGNVIHTISIARIDAEFRKCIYVDKPVTLRVKPATGQ